jgi:hypothetical protein
MRVSGQLHAPSALGSVSLEKEKAGKVPEPISTFWRRENQLLMPRK